MPLVCITIGESSTHVTDTYIHTQPWLGCSIWICNLPKNISKEWGAVLMVYYGSFVVQILEALWLFLCSWLTHGLLIYLSISSVVLMLQFPQVGHLSLPHTKHMIILGGVKFEPVHIDILVFLLCHFPTTSHPSPTNIMKSHLTKQVDIHK